jgi:hypothetical protein
LTILTQNIAFCAKIDHKIGFDEKRQFFRRNLPKIAENSDKIYHRLNVIGGLLIRVTILANFRPFSDCLHWAVYVP